MIITLIKFLLQITLAAGLEESGEITRFAAKEKGEIAMENLKQAARILQVEPEDMLAILQDRTWVYILQMTRILFPGQTDHTPKIFAIEGNPTAPN